MIEEIGVVVSVRGDTADVEARRGSACGGCAVNGACGTSLVAQYFGRKRLLLSATNAVGARPGDQVVIGLSEGALLGAALVAYLVPLLAMIGGAMVGAYFAVLVIPDYAQGLSVLGGGGAFGGALVWLRRFSTLRAAHERYRPRILRCTVGTPHGQAAGFSGDARTAGQEPREA